MLHTFDPTNEISKSNFVCDNITTPIQLSLATVGQDNRPRNVCVNYDLDESFNLFRKSSTTSQHSENISFNPHVGILIYGVYGLYDFWLYASGTVRSVEDRDELTSLLTIKYAAKGKQWRSPESMLGEETRRIYICELTEVYICDLDHKKTPVDLEILKKTRKASRRSSHSFTS